MPVHNPCNWGHTDYNGEVADYLEEKIWDPIRKRAKKGEHYTVPPDAEGPRLWTGRPDALAITVGGKEVPKLAQEKRTVKDVPVSAEALLARNGGAQPAAPPTG